MVQNIIIIAILALVLAVAVIAIVRAKKSGKKCVGCPESGCATCNCCKEKDA